MLSNDKKIVKELLFAMLTICIAGLLAVGLPHKVHASLVNSLSSYRGSSNLTGPNSGLVGWWTFDGADMKNNVTDKSGNGNNGYMVGFTSTSSAVVQGKMGQGLRFDGENDYTSLPLNTSLNMTGNLTLSAWVRPEVRSEP